MFARSGRFQLGIYLLLVHRFIKLELFSPSCDVTRPLNVVCGGLGLDRICTGTKIKKNRGKIHELKVKKRKMPET